MPVDNKCPGCGRLLRVGDEYVGRQARCPACSTIYVVPSVPIPADGPTSPIAPGGNPFGNRPESPENAVGRAPPAVAASLARYTTPHRGGLILVLGVLGWIVSCPVFGVAAWMMGASDLREMRCGRMDPAGEGITQAGYVLGMINSLLWIVGVVIIMVVLMIGLAASVVG